MAAVVTMQSMGEGATAYVGEAISGLGSNMLIAVPGASRNFGQLTLGVPLFTVTDIEIIKRDAHDVGHLSSGARSVDVYDVRCTSTVFARTIYRDAFVAFRPNAAERFYGVIDSLTVRWVVCVPLRSS